MSRNHEEFKIHIAIVKHHATAFPHIKLLFIPNAVRDASDAFFNKMMGAVPGAHDLMLFWGKPISVGIFEVKSRTGRLSSAQNKFASGMHSLGAFTGHGSSVLAYHDTLCKWGIVPRHNSILEPDLATKKEKRDRFDLVYARQAPEKENLPPEDTSGSLKF